MYKDLENYARFLDCIAAVAKTARLGILGVGGDLVGYLKTEAGNNDVGGTGDWINQTLDVVGPLAARADFYATLLYDAAGDPERARKTIEARRKKINDADRWTKAARGGGIPEDDVLIAAEVGRRIMDFESTLALALLNKPASGEKSGKSKR